MNKKKPAHRPLVADRMTVAQRVVSATFQGPLPPPTILRGYDDVVQGAAERLIVMAEKQQKHDHEIQKSIVKNKHRDIKRGQISAIMVTLTLAVIGGFIAFTGQPWAGAVIATGGVASIVAAFLGTHKTQQKNKNPEKSLQKPADDI